MIVNVNATLTQNVNVQLTPEECLEAIAKCLGVHSLVFPKQEMVVVVAKSTKARGSRS